MNEFLLFVLATIGFTHIVVDSKLMEPIRTFLQNTLPEKVFEVFTCYQCFGFWSGIVCGTILISYNPLTIFMCGCAGSFLSQWAANHLTVQESNMKI